MADSGEKSADWGAYARATVLTELEGKIKALPATVECHETRNNTLRDLYFQVMDEREAVVAADIDDGMRKEILRLIDGEVKTNAEGKKEESKGLRQHLQLTMDKAEGAMSKPATIAKFVAIAIALIFMSIGTIIICPLRILHPHLRKMGVSNGLLPVDIVARLYCQAVLAMIGLEVRVEGIEHVPASVAEGGAVCMFSHASNLDPFIVNAVSPFASKWVGKKELFLVPIIGWMAWALGFIPINRGNREKAIAALNESAAACVKKWKRSVAISPEGTRSRIGQIDLFKSGPFYLQQLTEAPVLLCTIQGAYELWPPSQKFPRPGVVTVKFLPPILPDPKKSRTELEKQGKSKEEIHAVLKESREGLAAAVFKGMRDALREAPPGTGRAPTQEQWIWLSVKRGLCLLVVWIIFQMMRSILSRFSTMQIVSGTVGLTAVMTGATQFTF